MVPEILPLLLRSCSKTHKLQYRTSLHGLAIKAGLQSVFFCNHILNMYAKCGNLNLAHQLFEEMPERNLVTWSALVSGYDQADKPLMALGLFKKMRTELEPNEFCFASALSSCARLMALRHGQQCHSDSLKLGYSSVSFVYNSLIKMYSKCGQCDDAISVFHSASGVTLVSYNAIITGLVENKQPEIGYEMFKTMRRQGLVPDHFTFMGLLGTCIDSLDFWILAQLHCQTIKLMLDSMTIIGNVLITTYKKFKLIEEAQKVFNLIGEKDVISWNTMIAACSHCDDHVRALGLFREMEKESSQRPDDFTYASLLSASAGLASIRHGKQIHALLIRTRSQADVGIGNALLNMYSKCGSIKHACAVFEQMSCHNLLSLNAMIAGFAYHGLGEKAIEMFGFMKDMGIKPDSVTFIGLLIACSHVGLVDEGQAIFDSMYSIYEIPSNIEHFSCLIDLLGRAGRFGDADKYVKKFHFGDDPVVLGCLLSACRLHGNVITGERLAKRILDLEPVTTSPYVLLSNLYASDGMWGGVAQARKLLKDSGLKKEPGHSLIDVEGFVKKFTIADFSHPRMEEILDILKILSWTGDEELDCY
ncbi:hypothetical protein M9H77_07313 [Catharanthus roseus]|uniref:Uncharacterized protein n=1 Tax=Catharanthus roseus TaxID=4058 RepID=A0ACC0BUY4_CATRO|nr:hypothetical protein M9H77_07313 [Catharanthus roseus]